VALIRTGPEQKMAQFQKGESGNPHGRPRGVQDRRTALRRALEGRADELLAKAVEEALTGNSAVLVALLSRLIPSLKPETVFLQKVNPEGTLSEQAAQIVSSALAGQISPSTASELLASLANAQRIKEADELEVRIDRLERIIHATA